MNESREISWKGLNDGRLAVTSEDIAECFSLKHDVVLCGLAQFFKDDSEGYELWFADTEAPLAIVDWKAYRRWEKYLGEALSVKGRENMKYEFWKKAHKDGQKVTGVVKVESTNEVGGNHYKMAIEPTTYIDANKMLFNEGNVVKYISRYKKKNGKEDLRKCIHYVLLTMKREYKTKDEVINRIMEELKNA